VFHGRTFRVVCDNQGWENANRYKEGVMSVHATARIIPIGIYDNTWRDGFFEFLNDGMDQILREIPMEKIEDFTGAVFDAKSEILGQLTLGFIKNRYRHLFGQDYCDCPVCGKRVKCADKEAGRKVESLGGCFVLYRPYFHCKNCGTGFCPLDEALGLASSPKQYDIQDLEARLSSELPFKTAEEACERTTGDSLSGGHMHDITNKIADRDQHGFDFLNIIRISVFMPIFSFQTIKRFLRHRQIPKNIRQDFPVACMNPASIASTHVSPSKFRIIVRNLESILFTKCLGQISFK